MGSLSPVERNADADRRLFKPWHKWYKSARWRALRIVVFIRDLYTCQWPGCGFTSADTSLYDKEFAAARRAGQAAEDAAEQKIIAAQAAAKAIELEAQAVREGTFETLVRVASTIEAVGSALDMLGTNTQSMGIAVKLGLADQFDSVSALALRRHGRRLPPPIAPAGGRDP